MIKSIFIVIAMTIFSQQIFAKASLGNIRAYVDRDYEEFVTELSFTGKIDLSKIKIKHQESKVVIVLPQTKTEKDKAQLKIKDKEVKEISVNKSKKDVNISIAFQKGISGNDFRGYSRVEKDGNLIRLSLKRNSYIVQQNSIRKELLKPVSLGAIDSSEKLPKKTEQVVVDLEANDEEKAEAEIPVLTKGKTKKVEAANDSLLSRLSLSLGLIFCFAVGLFLFIRWWSRTYKTQDMQSKIRVLTQHHLGPKKTLAIIRVAGESILVGITDHNINHIKTLSLLDGEIPDEVPVNFKSELDANFEEDMSEQNVVDSFSYGEDIKKTIKSRLKGLGL